MTQAALTHGTKLKPTLGIIGVALLATSWMSPAAGVFIIGPEILQQAGTGALWAYGVGALISIFIIALDLEALAAVPSCGGMYVFIAKALNPSMGMGYMIHYMIMALLVVTILAAGMGDYLRPFFPGLPSYAYTALTICGAFTISLLNLRANEWVTSSFLILELLLLALLFYIGASHYTPANLPLLAHSQVPSAQGWQSVGWAAFFYVAFGPVSWVLAGSQSAAVVFSEDMKTPRHFVWAAYVSFIVVVLVQLIPVAAVMLSDYDLAQLLTSSQPFSDFILHYMGPRWVLVASAGVAIATFNAVIVSFLFAMRILLSTARNHIWPDPINRGLSLKLARTDSLFGPALLTLGATLFFALLPSSTLMLFMNSSGALFTMLIPLACWRARRIGLRGSVRLPFFSLFIAVFVANNIMLIWGIYTNPHGGLALLGLPVAVLLLALAYHHFYLRHRPQFAIEGMPD